MSKTNVAILGLGIMGSGMANRLLSANFPLSVYNRNLYVGIAQAGKPVCVQFDPEQAHWLISDNAGHQLRTQPAPELNAESIRSLQLAGQK